MVCPASWVLNGYLGWHPVWGVLYAKYQKPSHPIDNVTDRASCYSADCKSMPHFAPPVTTRGLLASHASVLHDFHFFPLGSCGVDSRRCHLFTYSIITDNTLLCWHPHAWCGLRSIPRHETRPRSRSSDLSESSAAFPQWCVPDRGLPECAAARCAGEQGHAVRTAEARPLPLPSSDTSHQSSTTSLSRELGMQ